MHVNKVHRVTTIVVSPLTSEKMKTGYGMSRMRWIPRTASSGSTVSEMMASWHSLTLASRPSWSSSRSTRKTQSYSRLEISNPLGPRPTPDDYSPTCQRALDTLNKREPGKGLAQRRKSLDLAHLLPRRGVPAPETRTEVAFLRAKGAQPVGGRWCCLAANLHQESDFREKRLLHRHRSIRRLWKRGLGCRGPDWRILCVFDVARILRPPWAQDP
jgi:hypothetical protein